MNDSENVRWYFIYIYIMIALLWEMKLSRGENAV